jgi:hypothetical protein
MNPLIEMAEGLATVRPQSRVSEPAPRGTAKTGPGSLGPEPGKGGNELMPRIDAKFPID